MHIYCGGTCSIYTCKDECSDTVDQHALTGDTVSISDVEFLRSAARRVHAIAAGNGPDLAQMGTTWMADFSNMPT